MSARGDDEAIIDRVENLSTSEITIGNAITGGIALIIGAFVTGAADALGAIWDVIIEPLQSLAFGVADIVRETVGGGASIIGSGAATTSGSIDQFGILGFTAAVAIVLGTAWVFAQIAEEEETSDSLLPFTGIDLPLIGVEEENEE